MERVYYTWDRWECYPAGFFESSPKGRTLTVEQCKRAYADFLRDIPRFIEAMHGVLRDWPHSVEHNLTNEKMNRIAWLGQAAMCYAEGIPSRFCNGYMLLDKGERLAADMAALDVLNEWLVSRGEQPFDTLEDADHGLDVNLY